MFSLTLILAVTLFILMLLKDSFYKNAIELGLIAILIGLCIATANWLGAIIWTVAIIFGLLSFYTRYYK